MSEKKKDAPALVGDALQRFLDRSGLGERIEEAAVVPDWKSRVGAGIGEVTTPVGVNNGTLFVAVRSSSWLMELKMMETEILRRLNDGRDRGRIRKIRFFMAE